MSVKIINSKGKEKIQASRKGYFTTSGAKKAIVQLKKGEKITLFEVAQAEEEAQVTTAEGEPVAKVKKSLLGGPKVKIERESVKKNEEENHPTGKMHTQQGGKTKGEQ